MTGPTADRPHIPAYGQIPSTTEGMIDWASAERQLERAITYWVATAGDDRMPHLVPLWGVWLDGRCYVEGGRTRWQRNLHENPRASIKVETGGVVVLVEGVLVELADPPGPLSRALVAGFGKYRAMDYEADPARWTDGGLWELRPVLGFAWSDYPTDMARFRWSRD